MPQEPQNHDQPPPDLTADAGPTVDAGPAPTVAPVAERPGSRVGRYKLLEQIGEGGFGVVFMAEQQVPVRRQVALKVIKLGMDTRDVVARFEAERQALAMMDHPNIAKVLDAGATDAGRPYFVMELVRGSTVVEYADKHRLNTRDRVALLAQVCRAVQHAHGKGVIHRDLKPSNVLVTTADDRPVPKVIDFGIAKATQTRLTDRTLFTGYRQLIGTPQYMSPEQADSDGNDIDTRTDVYSLGVILYELLTGQTPFDARALRSAAYDDMRRMIRDTEPARPSTRLHTLGGDALATVATNRGTDTRHLRQLLHGELDWIVMRAIEKDRARRYDTAAALADDLNRYLAGEPVLAGPATAAYRMRKLARRYKAAFGIAAAVAAALLLGVIGTTAGLVRAEHQRHAAETARAEAEAARQDADAARAVAVREKVESDRLRLLAEAGATAAQANLFVSQGKFKEAVPLLHKVWEQRRQALGDYDPLTLNAAVAEVQAINRSGQPAAARKLARQVADGARRDGRAALPEVARLILTPTNGQPLTDPAVTDALREAADILRAAAPDDAARPQVLDNLACGLLFQHKPQDAEPVIRELLAVHGHRSAATTRASDDYDRLASLLIGQVEAAIADGRFAEAKAISALDVAVRPGYQDWYEYVRLCGYLGDVAEYRRACGEMRRRFATSKDLWDVEGTARAALMLPPAGPADLDGLKPMIDAAADQPGPPWSIMSNALLDYRRQDYVGALSLCRQCRDDLIVSGQEQADAVTAMALYRTGHPAEAQAVLARVHKRLADRTRVGNGMPNGEDVHAYLDVLTLLREADQLVGPTTMPATQPAR